MQFKSVFSRMAVAAVALAVVACGPSEEEKQIQALTAEIAQIEQQKNQLEAQMDSAARDKENVVAQMEAAKASATEYADKLKAANAGIVAAQRKTQELMAQLAQWKDRAEKLAKENEQLKAQIATLNQKIEAAEARAFAAEQRAIDAETKLRAYEAAQAKSYYVKAIDVKGFRSSGEEFSRERIKSNAATLRIDIAIQRPDVGPDLGAIPMRLVVIDSKGQELYAESFSMDGNVKSITIDVKGQKLDLNKGKHIVKLYDVKDNNALKFESFFMVLSSFL